MTTSIANWTPTFILLEQQMVKGDSRGNVSSPVPSAGKRTEMRSPQACMWHPRPWHRGFCPLPPDPWVLTQPSAFLPQPERSDSVYIRRPSASFSGWCQIITLRRKEVKEKVHAFLECRCSEQKKQQALRQMGASEQSSASRSLQQEDSEVLFSLWPQCRKVCLDQRTGLMAGKTDQVPRTLTIFTFTDSSLPQSIEVSK